jgi:hypothetical protein
MKLSKVKSNNFQNNSFRFDAKFHLSDGVYSKQAIMQSPYKLLNIGNLSDRIFYGGRARRIYVKDKSKGLVFIGSSDMLKSDISGAKLISKKYTRQLNEQLLAKDWILISRSGTIGNTVYTNEIFEGKAGSEHIMRVVPNGKVLSGFLYSYLSSSYGYNLLTQGTFGAVIQHIDDEHIAHIPVPIFPKEKQVQIHNLITEAATLRVEANRLLEEAVEVFEREIGVSANTTKIFSKKVGMLGFSWAAYNNNIECTNIYEKLENNSSKLGDLSENIFAPPLFKHIYLNKNNGYPFITGSELTKQNMRYYRWLSPRGVRDINDYVVRKGTLLLYKSGTTDGGILGNVFIADDNLDGVCLSDHIIRIKIEDIKMSYWVYAFLKSKVGVKLLQQLATGTMIPFITPERLKELPIPTPNSNYKFVTEAIENSLQKRVKANNNENQAISLVENEIALWQS